MRSDVHDESGAAFAEQLLALLDEGSFSTTYKYALLLAVIDCCFEHAGADGRPPATLHPRDVAQRVLALYWPQAVPYPGVDEATVLRQSNTGQAEIVNAVRTFRSKSDLPAGATRSEGARRDPVGFDHLLGEIEWKLVEMPLPRLQRASGSLRPFLYVVHWDERVRKRDYREPDFDRGIHLTAGAREHLIRFAGLLRPLVQRLWSDRVAQYNRLPNRQLDEFLFGVDRLTLVRVRLALSELQDGRCFYTGEELTSPEVDHFLPWARFPNNAIENLVVANKAANSQKRAHLVAPEHLENWYTRNERRRADLDRVASAATWETRPNETTAVVRSVYLSLRDGSPLWVRNREFVDAQHHEIAAALASPR